MDYNKLAHVVWDCKYHIVIIPKYRNKMFTKGIKESIRDELGKLCTWLRIEILEGYVSKDHIHLCLAIPPKYSISEVMATLKGKTAIRMFNKFPELRKRYWGSHFWSRGYYVNTVGRNEEMIREYIKNQDKLDNIEKQRYLFK